jgi:dCMP deaminase
MDDKWVQHFLRIAKEVATMSKDPSTKVGSVIVDEKRRVVGHGFNGLARGVRDTLERLENRELKYKMIVHSEINCILNAGRSVEGCTMYVTAPCCSRCAAAVIQAGIARVVWPRPSEAFEMRWAEDITLSMQQFEEAGVQVHVI